MSIFFVNDPQNTDSDDLFWGGITMKVAKNTEPVG